MKKLKKTSKKTETVRSRSFPSIIVFVLGLVIGGVLVWFGIARNFDPEYDILNYKNEETLKKDVSAKIDELNSLRSELNAEYEKSSTSEKYRELNHEVVTAEGELSDLEADLYNAQSGIYKRMEKRKISGSISLITLGVIVMVIGAGATIWMNNRKKRNKILTIDEEK